MAGGGGETDCPGEGEGMAKPVGVGGGAVKVGRERIS